MANAQIATSTTILSSGLIGYNGISLTEYDTSSIGAIAAGSAIEIAGAYFKVSSNETINASSWTAITTSTTAYVALTPSGSAGTQIFSAAWTATVPTWSTSKQGWYASAASSTRVVALAYKTSATGQPGKLILDNKQYNATLGGSLGGGASASYGGAIGYGASATIGGAVGQIAYAVDGFAGGYDARAGSGGALGFNTTTGDGGSIGLNATSTSGFSGGYNSATVIGGAVGEGATSTDGFAGGEGAVGNGTNRNAIGQGAINTTDNSIRLGKSGTTSYLGDGTTVVTSDARDKTDIEDNDLGLDFIEQVKTRKYHFNPRELYWKRDEDGRPIFDEKGFPIVDYEEHAKAEKKRTRWHRGVIAQELEALIDGVDFSAVKNFAVNQPDNDQYAMDYIQFIPVLIKAVQELSARVKELET